MTQFAFMNYLAHAYFSFRQPEWLVGNLISDFVKGRLQYDFPPGIQQGIRLHRAIDAFTDDHAATKRAKEVFRPHYRLYAGAFIDVVYDHFLANDPSHFASPDDLKEFAQFAYDTLQEHYDALPERYQQMFYRMREQNWLYNYRERWGMEKSFAGVVYRSRYLEDSATAFELFETHFEKLAGYYQWFATDLIIMLQEWRASAALPGN
jgi:acyl carrier protein phosphodiesterase